MASPSPPVTTAECDGYIPMSPRSCSFLSHHCKVESSTTLSPLTCQPGDLAPPPIHRHLKPSLRRGENQHGTDWLCLSLGGKVSFYFLTPPINSVAQSLVRVLIHKHAVRAVCMAVLMKTVNVSRRLV